MGLNNNVYNISQAIVSTSQDKQKQKEQKELLEILKIEFKGILLNELIASINENKNIFDVEFMQFIINEIFEGYEKNTAKNWLERFYYYKPFLQQFLYDKYFILCNKAESVAKKQKKYTQESNKKVHYVKQHRNTISTISTILQIIAKSFYYFFKIGFLILSVFLKISLCGFVVSLSIVTGFYKGYSKKRR